MNNETLKLEKEYEFIFDKKKLISSLKKHLIYSGNLSNSRVEITNDKLIIFSTSDNITIKTETDFEENKNISIENEKNIVFWLNVKRNFKVFNRFLEDKIKIKYFFENGVIEISDKRKKFEIAVSYLGTDDYEIYGTIPENFNETKELKLEIANAKEMINFLSLINKSVDLSDLNKLIIFEKDSKNSSIIASSTNKTQIGRYCYPDTKSILSTNKSQIEQTVVLNSKSISKLLESVNEEENSNFTLKIYDDKISVYTNKDKTIQVIERLYKRENIPNIKRIVESFDSNYVAELSYLEYYDTCNDLLSFDIADSKLRIFISDKNPLILADYSITNNRYEKSNFSTFKVIENEIENKEHELVTDIMFFTSANRVMKYKTLRFSYDTRQELLYKFDSPDNKKFELYLAVHEN